LDNKKVITLFTNDSGRYYIEQAWIVGGKHHKNNCFDLVKIINESEDWSRYKETEKELSSPTTANGETIGVINWLQE
jgi:hypothetical protein